MAFSYTAFKRFTKALTTWVSSDSSLVTLTGHNTAAGGNRIYVIQGTDLLHQDSLLIDPADADPWLPDVDYIFVTRVRMYSYASTRIKALDIIGAAAVLCGQNKSTKRDARFESDNIRTRAIQSLGINQMGKALFEATSIRRTERSDSPMADRHMSAIEIDVVWEDTT